MADSISNRDDLIDSRDIIERIDELESDLLGWRAKLCDFAGIDKEEDFATHEEATDALAEWLEDHAENYASTAEREACEGTAIDIRALPDGQTWEGGVGETALVATIETVDLDEDDVQELSDLRAFAAEGENYADDWHHGATFIRDSYFAEYAKDLVSDIGDMPRNIPSYIVIDWDATADNLRSDYTEITFAGVEYLVR